MQHSAATPTANGGLVMSDDIASVLLDALGIKDPCGKIEIILEAFKEVQIKITYCSHYQTEEGIRTFAKTLKDFNLVPKADQPLTTLPQVAV